MTTNNEIEKFISDHRQTKLVRVLFKANEIGDRSVFSSCLRDIRECIALRDRINRRVQDIYYHSASIKSLIKEKNGYKRQLKQLRDGCTKNKSSLFDEEGLKIDD